MNSKLILGIVLVTALTIGVVSVMADNSPVDHFMGNEGHEPSYDHNGNGHMYGDGAEDHDMLRDGSGSGGMYGNQDGDCNSP